MRLSSWTYDSPDRDPMLAEQFQIAIGATQIRTPELIEACREVLVDGLQGADVAKRRKIDPATVYRAITTVREKWAEICAAEGWVAAEMWLAPKLKDAFVEVFRDQLKRYSETKGKKRKKRKS